MYAAEALGALGEGDVVAVTGRDDDVRDVGQPEEIFDHVDREPDVGAILHLLCCRKELGQVDGAFHELPLVARVDADRPVGVGAREHDRAEARREVENRADVDLGVLQARGDLVGRAREARRQAVDVVFAPRIATVNLVVARDDDVVEVDVDRDAAFAWFCQWGRLLQDRDPVTPSCQAGRRPEQGALRASGRARRSRAGRGRGAG